MEVLHIVERDLFQVFDGLVRRGDVAQVTTRIGIHAVLELSDGNRLWIATTGLGAGDALLANGFEFAVREGGFAQDLGSEAECARKVGLDGFDARGGAS